MAETLLSVSEVLLYGRVMEDMQFSYSKPPDNIPGKASDAECAPPPRPGESVGLNAMMQRQLSVGSGSSPTAAQKKFAPRFARIYGFSYEGCYFDLASPIIMLVHGPGVPAEAPAGDRRAARAPDSPDKTGYAAADQSFADEILVWSYDKGDFSVRMDSMAGTIEEVLLETELGDPSVAGGRVSGGRVSGGRVAGGRVSGGRVSGGRVSGGRVSGGRVSGGKDD